MTDSRTNPLAPSLIGDDSDTEEIMGENEPLKMSEGEEEPPPGALDYQFPATSPSENPLSDPGQAHGSRDPDLPLSAEDDDSPGNKDGNTPYDAGGSAGIEGE